MAEASRRRHGWRGLALGFHAPSPYPLHQPRPQPAPAAGKRRTGPSGDGRHQHGVGCPTTLPGPLEAPLVVFDSSVDGRR
jgi:hypothetical protein